MSVVTLVPKEEVPKTKCVVELHYFGDEESSIIEAEYFGASSDIPGFLVLWNDGPDGNDIPKGLYSLHNVKKIITRIEDV